MPGSQSELDAVAEWLGLLSADVIESFSYRRVKEAGTDSLVVEAEVKVSLTVEEAEQILELIARRSEDDATVERLGVRTDDEG